MVKASRYRLLTRTVIIAAVLLAFGVVPDFVAIKDQIEPSAAARQRTETRCGWFHNPTPGNAWLIDRDGEWIIGAQGGYQAEGDWPNIPGNQWIKTNVNYGYGCACIRGSVDRKSNRVLQINNSYARPLSACRKDRALRPKEPK